MSPATTARAIVGAIVLCIALGGGVATAGTTRIGAVTEIAAGTNPDPITSAQGNNTWAVQVAEAAGTYAVPAGYGVITAWSHSTGGTPGAVTFKLYRPLGANRFLTLAANAREAAADTVHEFPVRIRARPGDRIGLSTTRVEVAYSTANPSDQLGMFPFRAGDPPLGSTATQDGPPFVGYKVDVAARVETDADGDGFGDDSQDNCPTSAASQGACPGVVLPSFSGCPSLAANVIRGTRRGDRIMGTLRADRIFARAGGDSVAGSEGGDCVDLGSGNDRGRGGPGADLMRGASGRDRIGGNDGNDRLDGQSGADRLSGGAGRDRLKGGSGDDAVNGGAGRDRIAAGSGADRVTSRDGRRDRVSCGRGADRVVADRRDRVARDCERVQRR